MCCIAYPSSSVGQRLALPWTGLDSDWTGPGQRFFSSRAGLHSDFTRLRQPLAAPSTGLDKDCTLLLEHSGRVGEGNNNTDMHVAVELLRRHAHQGMEPKRLRAQDNVVESTTNRKQ